MGRPHQYAEATLWGTGVTGGHRITVVTSGHLGRPPYPQGQGTKPKVIDNQGSLQNYAH